MASYYSIRNTNLFGVKNVDYFHKTLTDSNIKCNIIQSSLINVDQDLIIGNNNKIKIIPSRLVEIIDLGPVSNIIHSSEYDQYITSLENFIKDNILDGEICVITEIVMYGDYIEDVSISMLYNESMDDICHECTKLIPDPIDSKHSFLSSVNAPFYNRN